MVAGLMRREEVAGLVAQFKSLDADGDGKLSVEELQVGGSGARGRGRGGVDTSPNYTEPYAIERGGMVMGFGPGTAPPIEHRAVPFLPLTAFPLNDPTWRTPHRKPLLQAGLARQEMRNRASASGLVPAAVGGGSGAPGALTAEEMRQLVER